MTRQSRQNVRSPGPRISLTEHNAETLPIGMRNFIGNYSQDYGQLMAAGVVSTIPVMVAFFATQKWLVRGLQAGAVKG